MKPKENINAEVTQDMEQLAVTLVLFPISQLR